MKLNLYSTWFTELLLTSFPHIEDVNSGSRSILRTALQQVPNRSIGESVIIFKHNLVHELSNWPAENVC